jgi:hypothetical protein
LKSRLKSWQRKLISFPSSRSRSLTCSREQDKQDNSQQLTQHVWRKKKLQGGPSDFVKYKLVKRLEEVLKDNFANQAARGQALGEHFKRSPGDYRSVLAAAIFPDQLDSILEAHPGKVQELRTQVILSIERHWSVTRSPAIQHHSKTGSGNRYQHLINLLSKDFNSLLEKWEEKDCLGLPGTCLPKLKSKNRVNNLRKEIDQENHVEQEEDKKVAKVDLKKLLVASIRREQEVGYLKGRRSLREDNLEIEWGRDAAKWLRGLKHVKAGFKFLDTGNFVNNSPQNFKYVLLFEGKDNRESQTFLWLFIATC